MSCSLCYVHTFLHNPLHISDSVDQSPRLSVYAFFKPTQAEGPFFVIVLVQSDVKPYCSWLTVRQSQSFDEPRGK